MNRREIILGATALASPAWAWTHGSVPSGAAFPPTVSGTNATIAADFAGQQYWASAATQANFGAWMTAIGGTYSRSSSATYLQAGVVKTAAANGTRFPTDLSAVAQGIRLTGAATNLLLQSGNFSISSSNAGIITSTSGIGPDGSSAAISLVLPNGSATASMLYQQTSGAGLTAGAKITASCFFKAGAFNFGWVCAVPSGGARYTGVFDLTTGVMTASGSNGVPTGTSSGSVLLANGWVLVWVSCDNTATGQGFIQLGPSNTGTPTFTAETPNVTGDGVSGVLAFGGQVTNTGFPCDYIPTTTATVTQAADSLSFPFTQTTFSALVGTNGINFDGSGGQRVVGLSAAGGPMYLPDRTHFALIASAGLTGPAITDILNAHKTMATGNTTNAWLTSDGLTPITLAMAITVSTPTTLFVGSHDGASFYASGNYSQLAIWNALVASTSEMQRLTT